MLLSINTNPTQLFKIEHVFQQFRADILVRYHLHSSSTESGLSKPKNRMQNTHYILIIMLLVTVASDYISYTFLNLFKLLRVLCNYDS